jgi:serine/threonine-protein kinase HipA
MARRRTRIPLNVYLNATLVGQLNRAASGAIDFRYDAAWLERQNAIPVSLSLPLREDRYIGEPVVAFFDNLLPDSQDIRRRVAERSGAEGTDAYSLLSAIGRDCAGALQFLPENVSPAAGPMDAERLSDEALATLLADLPRNPLGIGTDRDFRISLAGVQDKTALLFWKNAWHLPHGTTPTTHIVKPQIGKLSSGIDLSQSVENEYLCLHLVAALGLPVAHSEIQKVGNRHVLVVERFDRLWTTNKRLLRIPQEDCCQALGMPSTRKYESDGGPGIRAIMDLLKGSDTPEKDQRLFFKAQLVFWLLAATDGHAKNFSLRLGPGGRFVLTPLYDILSTQPLFDAGQLSKKQLRLSMAIGDGRHHAVDTVMPRHYLQTAARCGVPEKAVLTIFDELISESERAIDKTLSDLPRAFPKSLAASIVRGFKGRLKLFADGSLKA